MLKSLILISALVAVATSSGVSLRRVSPFGIVEGITDCGSAGKLGTVSVSECNRVPCTFVPGLVYDIVIRYTASVTSDHIQLLVNRVVGSGLEPILNVPVIGTIEAGIEYDLTFKLPVTHDLSGNAFDIRFYIYDDVTFVFEVCAEASVIVT